MSGPDRLDGGTEAHEPTLGRVGQLPWFTTIAVGVIGAATGAAIAVWDDLPALSVALLAVALGVLIWGARWVRVHWGDYFGP